VTLSAASIGSVGVISKYSESSTRYIQSLEMNGLGFCESVAVYEK
jgi:hypothetical protein